jgi:hypothetical protein
MQDTTRFEDRNPAVWPGLSGALGSLRKGEEEEQGGSEGLLEALHAGIGARIGKKNAVGLGEAKAGWSLSRTASRRLHRLGWW